MQRDYDEFLNNKKFVLESSGFDIDKDTLNPMLFDFQKDIIRWALVKGRAAIFASCGLGKTFMQIAWAEQICKHHEGGAKVLILAPLSVSEQTVREGEKFGIKVNICASREDVKPGINITNYEKLDNFVANEFIGVVLDESSILKSFTGKIRNQIIDDFFASSLQISVYCNAST